MNWRYFQLHAHNFNSTHATKLAAPLHRYSKFYFSLVFAPYASALSLSLSRQETETATVYLCIYHSRFPVTVTIVHSC
jgi:hypothetical protein